jgi:ATP-dependent DNA helicase PIF1
MIKFAELDFNEEFVSAFEALENTGQHMFITGKAGTGKSTLLQYFREKTTKNVAVLAPTGVAAINIKGQTIHSFFNFKPDVTPERVGDIPVRKSKRKMYAELNAVIIDEVSMVRADLMDCVDIFLRLYGPHDDRPFGGIQMIFFGDLFQLPPVVGRGEEDIFKTHYPTPYFFSAKVFESLDFKIMQLAKIYRQKDEHFIRLLNAVRDDSVEHHHWETLNGRFKPKHEFSPDDFYIVLTTTNVLADKVNTERLKNLTGMPKIYQGSVSGEFERKSLPTPEILELKAGAQVMMLNNDTDKRWVNGSLGKILKIVTDTDGDDVIMVELENGAEVDVQKHTWEIYQYYFDDVNNALGSKVMGYFTQYPLKLAWAVTIHKSQGQTFERVVIDVGWGTFSHGQMYVALSRCTTLEGIVLKQPLTQRHILMDERVIRFMEKFIFLIVFTFFSTWAQAQTPSLDRTQAMTQDLSKIEDKQTNPNAWEEQNAQQPYVGLLAETDAIIHDDWSFDQDYHARVKIQKEAAKNLGQWPIYYNKSREAITDIEAYIETPDGKKLVATDIKDIPAYDQSPLYSDMRLKVITLPQINIGTIIDVRIKTKVFREEIPNQFWDEVTYPSIPTKYARYSYVFPKNKPIHVSAYNNDKQPLIDRSNGTVKYSYIFENTAYSESEDFMPPPDETIGVLSLSSINDWKQIADWWRDLINKNTVSDPNISAKALDLVNGKIGSKDKIHAILEFIQDNFRYVSMSLGDHTVDLHRTDEIFKSHYGDAKDLTLLTKQMLKIAGIDANIALFSGEFNGDPEHQLPNPSAFDHVILELNVDGQKYFVDPETKGFDLGELPSSYDNAHVMIIDANAYHFENIPVTAESFHSVVSSSDITLNDDGSANFHVSVKMPVEASQDFKNSWKADGDSNKQKFFDNLQATFAQGGKITDHDVKGLENRYGPVEFNFKYAASKVYQMANDMILLREEAQGNVPDFSEDKRHYPIFVPTNSLIINRNTYHIPEGLKINFIPKDYNLTTGFMQVSTKYSKGDGTITVESIYHLKRATIPPQGFASVKEFHDALDGKNEMYIVLKKKTNVAPEAETWIKNQ